MSAHSDSTIDMAARRDWLSQYRRANRALQPKVSEPRRAVGYERGNRLAPILVRCEVRQYGRFCDTVCTTGRWGCSAWSGRLRTGALMRLVAMFIAVGVVVPAITAVRISSAGAVVSADDAVAQPRIVAGLEEPLVPAAPTDAADDRALATALVAFRIAARLAPDEPAIYLAPLASFAKHHPHSGWTPRVRAALGLASRRAGYASRAIEAWQAAWAAGRHASDARARPLVDK